MISLYNDRSHRLTIERQVAYEKFTLQMRGFEEIERQRNQKLDEDFAVLVTCRLLEIAEIERQVAYARRVNREWQLFQVRHDIRVEKLSAQRDLEVWEIDRRLEELRVQRQLCAQKRDLEVKLAETELDAHRDRVAQKQELKDVSRKHQESIARTCKKLEQKSRARTIKQATKYEQTMHKDRQEFISYIRTLKPVPRYCKASIAILGAAGTGKPTLINKLVGKHVTKVGTAVTTAEFKLVHKGLRTDYYDAPGVDDRYSYWNVEQLKQVQPLHLILILYTKRVTSVLLLEQLVQGLGVTYVLVSNHVDVDLDSEANADEAKENRVSKHVNLMELTYQKEKKMLIEQGRNVHLIYVSARTGVGMDELRVFASRTPSPVDLSPESC